MTSGEFNGNKFTLNDDGTITIVMKDGRVIQRSPDGNVHSSVPNVKSVGIHNIVDIKTYSLVRHEGLTLHNIEFNDGGIVSFAFDSDGHVENATTQGAATKITPDGQILYAMRSRGFPDEPRH
ncbi:MAG TPA: hypothetical protein VGQ95_04260 [Chthoniobacterales bacterium]|nr:hypothetical protein [Chthoniobacterales bacterium]